MKVNRRNFLLFLGATAGSLASNWNSNNRSAVVSATTSTKASDSLLGFKPVSVPTPLATDQLSIAQQIEQYANYQVRDDLGRRSAV